MQKLLASLIVAFLACLYVGCKRDEVKAAKLVSGEKVPVFELPDLEGRMTSFSQFQGQVVMLNFWATWCAPCVAEMPAMERLYQALKDRSFTIVAINIDPPENLMRVREFIDQNGISFPILYDRQAATPDLFNVTGFPETFFVGPEGELLEVYDHFHGKEVYRVVADRPWDAKEYRQSVKKLLSSVAGQD